jgi:hypothetical protein
MKETEFVVVGNERWQITRARCIKPFLQTQGEAEAEGNVRVEVQVVRMAPVPPRLIETTLSLSALEKMVAMAREYNEELLSATHITITGDETVEGTVD